MGVVKDLLPRMEQPRSVLKDGSPQESLLGMISISLA
jgi:hypothetical protein